MCGGQLDQLRGGDLRGNGLGFGRRGDGVEGADDDQRGDVDGGDCRAEVGVSDGGAAGSIALDGGVLELSAGAGDDFRVGLMEVGGEPAVERAGNDRGEAFAADELDASVPNVGCAEFGGGAGEDEFVEALGRVDAEPLTDGAAHGESAEVGLGEAESVEKREDVCAELGDVDGAGGNGGLAVAAGVAAEELEAGFEGGELGLPHLEVDTEGVGEKEDREAGVSAELIVDAGVGELEVGHWVSPSEKFRSGKVYFMLTSGK